MNNYIAFILISLSAVACSSATSMKSPAIRALADVKYSLYFYKIDNGRFPNSWNEFISSGAIPSETLEYARKYCDIENRYYFFEGGKKVIDFGKEINILMMAKCSGREGDQAVSPDDIRAKGRYMIIEGANNWADTRRCSETELSRIFSDSGLNLSDYTEDYLEKSSLRESSQDNENSKTSEHSPQSKIRPESGYKSSEEIIQNGETTTSASKNYYVIQVIALAALIISAFTIYLTFRKK